MRTLKFIIVYFLCICSTPLFSQSIEIKGIVHFKNDPIENVSIQIVDKGQKAITHKNGEFHLQINQLPVTLYFTHVSYQKLNLKVSEKDLVKSTDSIIFIRVELEPNVRTFSEVTISGAKVQLGYDKPKTSVTDYEILGDYLYFILQDNARYLRITDFNSNTVSEMRACKNMSKLYKDSFDNLHIINQDSVYQVFYYNDSLIFEYPVEKQYFEQIFYSIAANTDSCLYLRYYTTHNQRIFYIKVDKETKKRKILATIFDTIQAQVNTHTYYGIQKQNTKVQTMKYNPFLYEIDLEILIEEDNLLFDGNTYYTSILTKPLYCPLMLINNHLYLFDHLNGILFQYNMDGKLIQKNIITYYKESGWAKEIIVNEEKTQCYAKFIKNGIVTLKEIDLETGDIKRSYTLEQHIFPEKIRIKDNYAFYLYKNLKQENNSIRRLWKQNLE